MIFGGLVICSKELMYLVIHLLYNKVYNGMQRYIKSKITKILGIFDTSCLQLVLVQYIYKYGLLLYANYLFSQFCFVWVQICCQKAKMSVKKVQIQSVRLVNLSAFQQSRRASRA